MIDEFEAVLYRVLIVPSARLFVIPAIMSLPVPSVLSLFSPIGMACFTEGLRLPFWGRTHRAPLDNSQKNKSNFWPLTPVNGSLTLMAFYHVRCMNRRDSRRKSGAKVRRKTAIVLFGCVNG
ncbi:hypothetical protein G6L14_11280 [Agrobacterium vitis]|nr:hypothetical protein [Agrobacterium vitis]NSY22354.1 hypothetical protein [Agrobacterium vitis]NTA22055.1 hypothetical protein [Agrobacterium vitis]